MKHPTEEQLILYHYREGENPEDCARHLAECPSCQTAYRELQDVLESLKQWSVPERPICYGDQVWRRLQHHISPSDEGLRRSWLFRPIPRWAVAISMFILLVGAFFLGRYWPQEKERIADSSSGDYRQRILLVSVLEHLDRSQRILQELVHQQGNGQISILADQNSIRDLLTENRLYRQASERSGQAGLADLLEDLEYLFLQLSNRPSVLSSVEFREMQQRLESTGILFKLQIIGSRLHEQEDKLIKELSRRAS
jgi:hypothetical protein